MITKAKKLSYIISDGSACETIEEAKGKELMLLIGSDNILDIGSAIERIVTQPREAIAILRLGLPRKPRTVKPSKKASKKPAAAIQPA